MENKICGKYYSVANFLDAAKHGDAEKLKELLKLGFNPNLNANFANTALHLAVYQGHLDCVKILLEAGAKTDVLNADAETPEDLAVRQGFHDIKEYLRGWNSIRQKNMLMENVYNDENSEDESNIVRNCYPKI